MKNCLNRLVFVALLGLGLPLLMSGCGPKLTDPHEMWDRLVTEKNITNIAEVSILHSQRNGYTLTIYAVESSAREILYHINSKGEISEQLDPNWAEWHGNINLSPDQIDLDALVVRIPPKDDPHPGCDQFGSAALTIVPSGKIASWVGCSNVDYIAGTLLLDGKPVRDQIDPRDPTQIAELAKTYEDMFGAGTLVGWNATLREDDPVYVTAIPFADDPSCTVTFFQASPPARLACSEPDPAESTIPFDLSRFSPALVDDVMTSLESLDIQVSAIDELIFTGTPDGRLKWDASTRNIGDKYEYYDQMRGVLEPIK